MHFVPDQFWWKNNPCAVFGIKNKWKILRIELNSVFVVIIIIIFIITIIRFKSQKQSTGKVFVYKIQVNRMHTILK